MKRRKRGSIGWKLIAAFCALIGLLLSAPEVSGQTVSEYDVEAAYLYNFGKFVQWPASASKASTFQICILGPDPFGGTLDRLIANDTIDGKPIVKRLIDAASDAAGCNILYIADSEAPDIRRILAALNHQPELLVSSISGFISDGGTVQFLLEEHRVRFEINLDAASQSDLVPSSELLKVAVSVIGKPRKGVTR